MNFNPLSETEVLNLIPAGEYDFLVKEAEDRHSKTGNEMIKLTLAIWDANGNERIVFDYLLDKLMYKVKHFADAVGLEEKYLAGGYSAQDCLNLSGRCKVIVDEPEENSPYPPKNSIKDYCKADKNAAVKLSSNKAPQKESEPFIDSDLPF